MKKCVIYARYSSDSQTEQSIEGQLRVCREYAEANNVLVVDTYIDRAMTGTNDNRASFQKMLKDSAKRQWQYVVVYKLDRFSRNKFESVIHKKTLKDNGVSILSAMENLTDSPEGRMMETILEGFNQYFSEELTQKVNRGLKESWRKGNATGGHDIFGYDLVNKKYVVNEYESAIVQEAFTKYSQGYKAVGIAELFSQCGYRRKNGKPIDHKYLYTILHNKRYTGVVEHQGEVYTNIFPRIISDDLWEKVNAINEENKLAPSRKKEIFDYILSGKLICGDCKHKMGGESGTSHTGDVHYYYICLSRRKKRTKCDMKPVQKQWLEDTVINTTVRLLENVSNIHTIAQRIYEEHKKEVSDNTSLKLIERKRAEAVKAQNNMIKAIEQGIITEATKSRLTELETQILQYDFEIVKEKARSYTYLTIEQIEMFLRKFVFDDTSDIKVRKLLVNAFIREVILYKDEIVITYNFTDDTEHIKFTKEHVLETERQIESAPKTAFSSNQGSYLFQHSAPFSKKYLWRITMEDRTQEIQKKLADNPMFEAFQSYLKKYGKLGCIKVTENQSNFIGSVRYGKSHVYFNAYIDSKGAISDLIFDLREVFQVYKGRNVKTGQLVFINDVDIHERLEEFSEDKGYFFVKDYQSGAKDDTAYFALGISLVGYHNSKFNKYTPWAGAIYEVLEALDKAHGFEGTEKKNKIKREDVDKAANDTPFMYWMILAFFYLVGIGGLALIIAGISKTIAPALGWIFGIICLLVFLVFGLTFTFYPITHKKEYDNNSGDLEKNFSEAKESVFR